MSISSKMMVGRLRRSAMSALRASIRRDISPPEAISATGSGSISLFAEKRKVMWSSPKRVGELCASWRMRKRTWGIPNSCKVVMRACSMARAASERVSLRAVPRRRTSASRAWSAVESAVRCSSEELICSRRLERSSRSSISSSQVVRLCL